MITTTHILPGLPTLTYDAAGPDDGPLVVCLHGLSADRTSWSPVIARFGDRWRVVALDLRGHGGSGHSTGGYQLDDYVADAERLLHALGRPAVVVGHSLGAIVAVVLAQRAHPLVRAVLLEDPPLYVVDSRALATTSFARTFPALRDHAARLRSEGAGQEAFEALLAAAPHPSGGTLGDRLHGDALASRAGALLTMDLDAVSALLDGRTFATFDPSAAMHCPVTVVRADPRCDAAFLPEHEVVLRSTNPDVHVVALAGGGHNLRGDRATRSAYLDLVALFLARNAHRPVAVSSARTGPTEYVLAIDGRRIAYATRGPSGDSALVFVHGWPDSWRSWQPVLEHLPTSESAVAVSLAGYGRSDAPVSGFAPSDLARDVAAVIHDLGLRSVVLVGHSLGSVVVQHLAGSLGPLVSGVVLVGGFARLDDEVAHEVTSALAELDDLDECFVREFQASTLANPVDDDLFEQIVFESLQASIHVWRRTFAALVEADPPATAISAPVLLLWGDRDGLVPRCEQERLLAAHPDVRLKAYAGGGHSPNWEEPARVAADIVGFLDEVRGRDRDRA